MKKVICMVLLFLFSVSCVSCGKKETSDNLPTYDKEASLEDEGVRMTETGEIEVPSYSEEFGHSNGTITITTPEKDGNYDILTYNFPLNTLDSITCEMHFKDEAQAKRVHESLREINAADLKIEKNVVTYTKTDSEWMGFKKRDILSNMTKTWEQLGYRVENK